MVVSRSVTKDLQTLGRMNENPGIMRIRSAWMRMIRAFVTDLDTRSLFWPPVVHT